MFSFKKRVNILIALGSIALLLGLTGCGATTPASSGSQAGASVGGTVQKYRLGHVFSVNSVQDKAAHHFADLVKDKTKGAVEITIFPASQIGGDEALGQDLSRGNLDFSFLNQGSLAGMDKLLDFHYLPYIATNYKQVDALYYGNGIIPQTMNETLAKHNIHMLASYELEFRGLSNSKHPVTSINDMKDLKLRVPGSKAIMGFFQKTGAQAVAIPMPELYTALQQKTVDGQDNGVEITFDNKLQETNKYYTRLNHVYASGTIDVSDSVWKKVSPEVQKALTDAAKETQDWEIKENRKNIDDYIGKMKSEGVQVVDLTPEQTAEFQKVGASLWDQFADIYGADRIEKLKQEVSKVKDLK